MDSSSPKRHLSASPVNDTTSERKEERTTMISRVGIDLAKNVNHLHGQLNPTAVHDAVREESYERCQGRRDDL